MGRKIRLLGFLTIYCGAMIKVYTTHGIPGVVAMGIFLMAVGTVMSIGDIKISFNEDDDDDWED